MRSTCAFCLSALPRPSPGAGGVGVGVSGKRLEHKLEKHQSSQKAFICKDTLHSHLLKQLKEFIGSTNWPVQRKMDLRAGLTWAQRVKA